jgi:hypothetical protein
MTLLGRVNHAKAEEVVIYEGTTECIQTDDVLRCEHTDTKGKKAYTVCTKEGDKSFVCSDFVILVPGN